MADNHQRIPVEVIFNPNWWFCHYGISFNQPFYLDKETRIQNDLVMRRVLFERFGLGEDNPQPRPVIGSMYVAGGFLVPALFGGKVRFAENEAPVPLPLNLSREEVFALKAPDLETAWPMDLLITDMDLLEAEYGYVVGDFDTDGILNTALHLRGQQLFIDFIKNPDLIQHLFSLIAETTQALASYMKRRTGTCAIATNRSILKVDPQIYLHSNCSVQMISPATYEKYLLPYEVYLSERLKPYGIHHCGKNLDRYAAAYAKVPAIFYDVGWGSDVARCREAFPGAFLNLRLSPVDMLWKKPGEIRGITTRLLDEGYSPERTGVCCINMDYGTPDKNVMAMVEAVENYYRTLRSQ
jgi:uroporphyrinogen-III decarboxylase